MVIKVIKKILSINNVNGHSRPGAVFFFLSELFHQLWFFCTLKKGFQAEGNLTKGVII